MTPQADSAASFRSLAEVVYAGSSYDEVYAAVVGAAVSGIDGCDHASFLVKHRGRFHTVAASDDIAARVDELERELDEGPCVEAIEGTPEHWASDLSASSPWPELTRRVLEETPVRAMGGFRIHFDGERQGALNIFCDTAECIGEHSLSQAAVLAAFASTALVAVRRGEEAATLRSGLESNREIGKAIGLLMGMHDLTDDEAFALLAKVSQDVNQKLAKVAGRVVAQHREQLGAAVPPATRQLPGSGEVSPDDR